VKDVYVTLPTPSKKKRVHSTLSVAPSVNLDLDRNGDVLGVEIIGADEVEVTERG
jgi:uncharacterized protein YuzE